MKRTAIFIGVFLVFVVVLIVLATLSNNASKSSSSTTRLTSLPTTTTYLISTQTPTQVPTSAPTYTYMLGDDEWVVVEVHDLDYKFRGVMHDTAVFQNKLGEQKEGMCAAPSWPQPEPGDVFALNQWGVFIPLTEDPKNPTQRFIALDSLYE